MTLHAHSGSNSEVKLLVLVAGLMAFAVPCALGQAGAAVPAASTPESAQYVPTMTFEVASVR
jgi:hypothetical protein